MENKVAIITGGSSGIGKALAEELGKKGYSVVITGRNEQTLQEVQTELEKKNIDCQYIVADVSKLDDCRKTITQTLEKYKKIDVLVNNAGISMRAMFEVVDLKVLHQLMDINFWGTVYMTQLALESIKKSKGSIVGISSIAGHRGLPARTGYSASKFAMNGFLEALRTELLHEGVHVLTVSPGFTASNIRFRSLDKEGKTTGKTGREEDKMMSSEVLATKIYEAILGRKRTLTTTFQGKLAIWLNKWFPAWADKLVYSTLAKEKNSPLIKK